MLAELGHEDEVVAAGLLHDVVEDTSIDVEQLRDAFGDVIADLVYALSEDADVRGYAARKKALREGIAIAGPMALAISGADKLARVRAADRRGQTLPARKLEHYQRTLDLLATHGIRTAHTTELERRLRLQRLRRAATTARSRTPASGSRHRDELAGAARRGLDRHARDAAPLDAGGRQDPPRARAEDQPLVEVTLYVTPRGLTTSAMPSGDRGPFEIDFDFCAITAVVIRSTAAGAAHNPARRPRRSPCSTPRSWTRCDRSRQSGSKSTSASVPVRSARMPSPFDQTPGARQLRPAAACSCSGADLAPGSTRHERVPRPLSAARSEPVHFFWGAIDLAVTRFRAGARRAVRSARRTAATAVMVEGYSRGLAGSSWPASSARSSTPTPTPSPTATARRAGAPRGRVLLRPSSSSSYCPTRRSGPPPTPTRRCSGSRRARTTPAADLGRLDREALRTCPSRAPGPTARRRTIDHERAF